MSKFFSFTLRYKKLITVFLLFFVVLGVGIFAPNNKSADASIVSGITNFFLGPPNGGDNGDAGVLGNLANGINSIGPGIIRGFLALLLWVTGLMAYISKALLEWVIELPTKQGMGFTTNLAVTTGWPIVRNLADMLVVITLIGIAMATILRYEPYAAKKLLPKLIIVALLVNFSLLICGIFIDVSNIVMGYFTNLGAQNNLVDGVGSLFNSGSLQTTLNLLGSPGNTPLMTLIAITVGQIFYNIMSAIILFLYVFLFLARIIALWVLIILSPMAFVCYAVPLAKAQDFWNKWWNNIINWCFIGMSSAFFLYIGEKLMTNMVVAVPSALNGTIRFGGAAGGASSAEGITQLPLLFSMIIPGVFLIIGFLYTLQTSAMGAGLAISAFNKSKGYITGTAWGATKGIAKYASDKSGGTARWENARNRVTQTLENYGVGGIFGVHAGYTEARRRKQLQPAREHEEYAAAKTNKQLEESIGAGSGRFGGKTDRSLFMADFERATEKGVIANMLSSSDPAKKAAAEKAMAEYVSITKKTETYSKVGGADNAHLDTDAIAELKRTGKAANDAEAIRLLKSKTFKTMDKKWMDDKTDAELDRIGVKNTDKGAQVREMYIREGKQNRLFSGDKNQLEQAILDDISKYGVSTNLLSKISPDSAYRDTDKIKAILARSGKVFETGKTNSATSAELNVAGATAVKEAWQDYKVDTSTAKDDEVKRRAIEKTAEGAKFLQEALKRNILGEIRQTYGDAVTATAVENGTKYGLRPQDLEAKSAYYAPLNPSRMAKLKGNNPIRMGETAPAYEARIGKMATDQVIDGRIGKMDGDELRELRIGDLTPVRFEHMAPEKVYEFQFASQPQKNQLKNIVRPALNRKAGAFYKEYLKALNATPQELAKAEQALDKFNKLMKVIKAIATVTA